MTRQIVKDYVDKHSLKLVEADTPFKGSDERFEELQKLGIADEMPTSDEVLKEDIIKDLKEAGIKHNEKDNKETLFKLLHGEE